MPSRRFLATVATLCLALGFAFAALAQQPATEIAPNGTPTIRTETRVVLVDTVVTDKKGVPIRDLTAKDFKVWEDNKEQAITSFSFEEDNAAPGKAQPRYMVLFFDNSTMDAGDQVQARQAAAKFIDANAGPNRLIAIADFGGSVHIAQNFTADAARLKQVVAGIKGSNVSPNAAPVEVASLGLPPGMPSLGNAEAEFGVHSVMLALRSLAKSLSTVPGRKTLVMLTSGFAITPEYQSELTAVIDACNKSNVAIYPIDVRGLVTPADLGATSSHSRVQPLRVYPAPPRLSSATLTYTGHRTHDLVSVAYFGQHGGSGGGGGGHGGGGTGGTGGTGGGGGTKGGGGTGGTGGKGGTVGTGGTGSRGPTAGIPNNSSYTNYNQPRQIVPQFPESASTNQQVLYQLAEGTGGFVIVNTNDLLGGLDKIAKDQAQYYVLGYKPSESPDGSCHTLRVKVERGGSQVRARSGYCNVKPQDLLAGNPIEKTLESRATGELPGNVTATMQAPFFYTAPNTARVNLAIDIPSTALKFDKVKGKQHSAINVLGIAYKTDGTAAARFSDTVDLDLDGKKEVEQFQQQPFHYENQFEIAAGQYTLRVVFSSGNDSFGKLEQPLVIDPYAAKQFSLSAIALSGHIARASDMETGLDADLLENKTPLIARGMQFTPSASNRFKTTDNPTFYVEMYAPSLVAANPPKVALEVTITNRKTGEQKVHVGVTNTEQAIQPGNPVVPLGLKLPINNLTAGSYRLVVKGLDSTNQATIPRTADFELE